MWGDNLCSTNFVGVMTPEMCALYFVPSMNIHVKLEKFKRGRSPSLHLTKEGDFA